MDSRTSRSASYVAPGSATCEASFAGSCRQAIVQADTQARPTWHLGTSAASASALLFAYFTLIAWEPGLGRPTSPSTPLSLASTLGSLLCNLGPVPPSPGHLSPPGSDSLVFTHKPSEQESFSKARYAQSKQGGNATFSTTWMLPARSRPTKYPPISASEAAKHTPGLSRRVEPPRHVCMDPPSWGSPDAGPHGAWREKRSLCCRLPAEFDAQAGGTCSSGGFPPVRS